MRYYDLIIVGAGPAGLALAHTTSSIYRRVLIIDKEQEIGGCHRVKRNSDGMFTEHGPRIYLSTYYNFFNLVNELGFKVEDIFVNYKYSFFDIAYNKILPHYNFFEIMMLTIAYLMFFINDDYGKDISLYEYLRGRGFSHKVIDMFDRLCRFTDGGNVYSYSLNKILKLIDSMLLLKIYQPRSPLDIVLFSTWRKFLSNRGVDFMLGFHITDYDIQNNNVEIITLNNGEKIKCGKIVFAVPPVALLNIIKYEEGLRNAFGNYNEIERWVDKTKYIDYISITFHFKEKLKLPYINGLSLDTDWGIGLINLSDFMDKVENGYLTVLSTAVSICNRNSNYTYKKANECTADELIKEVHRQIKESIFNDLSDDYIALINPNNYYNVHKNKWECKDNAYFNVYNEKYIPFESGINNLYNLGTHNGKSYISYTTIESAVSNAIYLAGEIYPEVQSKYTIYKGITGKNIVMVIIVIISVLLYYFLTR
jgi:predicted NAD/FAD-dependent oxidoreductase